MARITYTKLMALSQRLQETNNLRLELEARTRHDKDALFDVGYDSLYDMGYVPQGAISDATIITAYGKALVNVFDKVEMRAKTDRETFGD